MQPKRRFLTYAVQEENARVDRGGGKIVIKVVIKIVVKSSDKVVSIKSQFPFVHAEFCLSLPAQVCYTADPLCTFCKPFIVYDCEFGL